MDPVSFVVTCLAVYGILVRTPGLVGEAMAERGFAARGEESPAAVARREKLEAAGISPAVNGKPMRRYLGNVWRDYWADRVEQREQDRADGKTAEARSRWQRFQDRIDEEMARRVDRWRTDTAGPNRQPSTPDGSGPVNDDPAGDDTDPPVVHASDEYTAGPDRGESPTGGDEDPGRRRDPIRVDVIVGDPIPDPARPRPAPPEPRLEQIDSRPHQRHPGHGPAETLSPDVDDELDRLFQEPTDTRITGIDPRAVAFADSLHHHALHKQCGWCGNPDCADTCARCCNAGKAVGDFCHACAATVRQQPTTDNRRRNPIRVAATVGNPTTNPTRPQAATTVAVIEGEPMSNGLATTEVTGVVSGAQAARLIGRQIDAATSEYVAALTKARSNITALGEQTVGNVQMAVYSRVVARLQQAVEAAAAAQADAQRCNSEVGPLLGLVAGEFDRLNS